MTLFPGANKKPNNFGDEIKGILSHKMSYCNDHHYKCCAKDEMWSLEIT